MNFDTFSVAAIASEMRNVIINGRVQQIIQINSLSYALEVYVHPIRHYLTISVEPQAPRLYLTEARARRGVGNETPLMMVLRKYMRGAILEAVEQPPYERILEFHFKTRFGPIILTVELLGTRSNILLLSEDKTILGVARLPKATARGRQKNLLPGHFYEPPAPQKKLPPTQFTELHLHQALSEAKPDQSLVKLLPQFIAGFSPFVAREVVYRATGNTKTTVEQLNQRTPLLDAFHEVFTHFWANEWQAHLILDEDEQLEGFASFKPEHLSHTQATTTFSEAIEKYFAEVASGYSAAKTPLFEALVDIRSRLKRRHERLVADAAAQANPEELKSKGEALLAFAHTIQPGQTEFVPTWGFGDDPPTIKLDPALSASDNAQQYFNRYRKALRAADEIPEQLKKVELEQSYIDQLEQDLKMAEDRPEIDTISAVLSEAGYIKTRKGRKRRKKPGVKPLRLTAPDGATVWVGKNALQNAELTFNRATGDDLWLHARGIPGAHVLIPTAQGLPSEEDVFWAASVAAHYSKARNDTSVEVDVTLKKHVRAIKGAALGLVTYRNESTFRVVPEEPDLD